MEGARRGEFVWTKDMEYAFTEAIRREGLHMLAEVRHEIGDAYVALDIWLPRAICWHCYKNLYGIEDDDPPRPHKLTTLRSSNESICCIYDRANHNVTFIIDEDEQEPYSLPCWRCGQDLEVYDGSKIPVEIDPFGEHFRIPDCGPIDPSARLKRMLKSIYGNTCIGCAKEFEANDLTIDHIIARTHGGDASPLNLQVLCRACNETKANQLAKTVELFLDLLLIPYAD